MQLRAAYRSFNSFKKEEVVGASAGIVIATVSGCCCCDCDCWRYFGLRPLLLCECCIWMQIDMDAA